MKTGTKEYYSEYYNQNKDEHNARAIEWQSKNKDKASKSVKKWQENNVDKVREYDKLRKREQTKQRRLFVDEYKSNCTCKKCGENRTYVLDFHHVDPSQKSFDLGSATKYGIEKLKLELEKCITLCRNCHSEFHYIKKEQNITIDEYLH
jgi:Zn finger protein HypA/HybF involved in hydrogenase expression